jgi:flagellar hook-associated protein 3 FlgL
MATGKRILRASDDAVGSALVISLRRQAGNVQSFQHAVDSARPPLDTGSSALEDGSQLLSEARALTLQGINGTLGQEDRNSLAYQIDLLRQSLLEAANVQSGDRHVFGGTATDRAPFEEYEAGGTTRVRYMGNDEEQHVSIGRVADVPINVSGRSVFAAFEYTETSFTGVTGARHGTSADSGTGFHTLVVRHDATSGLGAGIVSANGGTDDTIVGDHALVIDATAGTAQLGTGEVVVIPGVSTPEYSDFVLEDADGSEIHLDLTGWSGLDFSGTAHGDASIALDGGSFAALDLSATDLELTDEASSSVLHIDATSITRAGEDLVNFRGASNVFDTLQGIADDLRSGDDLGNAGLVSRLNERLGELDRNSANLLGGLGQLGSRVARLETTGERLGEVDLRLKGLISDTQEADLSSVALELTRAEQTLQVAQATGARLLQQSLLNYLR